MIDFLKYEPWQRKKALQLVSNKRGLPEAVVEKDWWVSNLLNVIFGMPAECKIIFKGGTSLSKAWKLIDRFSEDIDISVDPSFFGAGETPTKKQIKHLRKCSSLFVAEEFAKMLQEGLTSAGLSDFCTMEVQPNGEGDKTYPEPRKISIHYQSLFENQISYVRPTVLLEIGARAMTEPVETFVCKSMLAEDLHFQDIECKAITTAAPQKTFIEKAFLLHELFSVERERLSANRRSRHLYDLERMMDKDFAVAAVEDDSLCSAIQHHRSIYTPVFGVDYSVDFRKNIVLIPPENIIKDWEKDYNAMCLSMIYGDKPDFKTLINRMEILQKKFKARE
ncbi:MAG: nucleotidyl transferase AbiEii/AbiGii toxin family protein [Bacteroidales bacterium]|nr:nucleotidyl transferase AbiEii/AbiGii toxin family protein [Bacteroidales bacterium]